MKGMILAAGYGTRMGPISNYLAKPAIPFLGVPMIEHSIGVLRSGGIRDIIINIHHMPDTLINLLGDGNRLGVKIEYSFEKPILGSGGGIGYVRNFFDNETFVVVNSDIIVDIDLNNMIDRHRSEDVSATLLLRRDEENNYGKVVVDEVGIIRKIEGNPDNIEFHGGNEYMFAGVHIIEPEWFDYTPDTEAYESFPDVYGPMIAAGKKINSFITKDRWVDLGTAKKYLHASLDCLVGNLIPNPRAIKENSHINRSILTFDTVVADNCDFDGVISLGPATIEEKCKLTSCILCPGTTITTGTVAENRIFYDDTSVPIDEVNG